MIKLRGGVDVQCNVMCRPCVTREACQALVSNLCCLISRDNCFVLCVVLVLMLLVDGGLVALNGAKCQPEGKPIETTLVK